MYLGRWNMSLNDITVDDGCVTRLKIRRNTVLSFQIPQIRALHFLDGNLETICSQVLHPTATASTIWVFEDRHRRRRGIHIETNYPNSKCGDSRDQPQTHQRFPP